MREEGTHLGTSMEERSQGPCCPIWHPYLVAASGGVVMEARRVISGTQHMGKTLQGHLVRRPSPGGRGLDSTALQALGQPCLYPKRVPPLPAPLAAVGARGEVRAGTFTVDGDGILHWHTSVSTKTQQ